VKDIILTGPKHSGKTTIGRELAKNCSVEFIDIDDLITQRSGKSPRQLFTENPALFQKAETEALISLNGGSNNSFRVIAAGGGIIDNPGAAAILRGLSQNKKAVIVYLDVSASCAWSRISDDLPPFLQTANPQETHRLLHERRAAAYRSLAAVIIEAESKTPKEITELIACFLLS
jgi:shikimate kinase